MAKNIIVGLGNAGTNCIKAAASSPKLEDVTMYSIDSVASSIDLEMINRITVIPIISDEKSGSGRDRSRGRAMYEFHEEQGAFKTLYEECYNAKAPVVVITSAAGGTGSGSVVPFCKALIERDIQVIPIIICPNMDDPDAYHLNTNDLMIELNEIGVETYAIFRNSRGDADYTPVNNEVVEMIEIIFGKKYDRTTLDSIDDSDLDVVLNMPGRFIAVSATAPDINSLKKELTRKVLSGFQPSWTDKDSTDNTLMTAYSLTSMYADTDFKTVFSDLNARIHHVYDEYRNICRSDNGGVCSATIIVAGLPRAEVKEINANFNGAGKIGAGMNKSVRPGFMKKKKATIDKVKNDGKDGALVAKFNWK